MARCAKNFSPRVVNLIMLVWSDLKKIGRYRTVALELDTEGQLTSGLADMLTAGYVRNMAVVGAVG